MENQFKELKEWCLFILTFIYELSPNQVLSDSIEQIKSMSVSRKSINELYHLRNDLNEWTNGLSIENCKALNQLLLDQFGKDLSFYSKEKFRKINQIMKRGKISSDEEFRMIDERVNEICQSEHNKSELEKLNDLLLKYETKNA